jgi:7-cyano-7-deazaguanine synthase
MKVAVVFSGGMDSATLAKHYAVKGNDLLLISFDYGQRHGTQELTHAAAYAATLNADHRIVDMAFMRDLLHGSALTSSDVAVPDGHYAAETMKATVVPNRNAIMFSIATGIAIAEEVRTVAVGIHAGDHFIYPDCRPAFFEPFKQAMTAASDGFGDVVMEAPFINMSKADIAHYGVLIGVQYELTWSCYKGGEIHCGTCGTCVERIEAFHIAQYDDPTVYADKAYALKVTGN